MVEAPPLHHRHPLDGLVAANAIIGQLAERACAGQLQLCEHLAAVERADQALVYAYWVAARASRLRCDLCAWKALDAVEHSRTANRCDHCHRRGQRLLDAYNQPVNRAPAGCEGYARLNVMFQLCGRCRTVRPS